MKGIGFAVVAAVLSVTALAEIQIINGKKYECRDGMCMPVADEPADGVKLPAVGGLELPPELADEQPVARPPAAEPSKPAVAAEATAEAGIISDNGRLGQSPLHLLVKKNQEKIYDLF